MRLLPVLAFTIAAQLGAQTASIPAEYNQPYRPQYHYSPQKNWTNDPNGLVYFEGEYHLFYQYNPFGDQWGHMTWGHAVSPDLVHWQELPPSIKEENGVMIFTGSTVIDQNNTSGFCKDGKPCMIAVYTGHTPEHGGKKALQTQNIAYSNDRGRTWTKYAKNPVVDLHMPDFRDPKVFWSSQAKHWVMVVALPNDHKVKIYSSPNLKQWTEQSEFGPAGAVGGQWECPELFELPVEGPARDTRWVLKIGLNPGALQGGSGEQYFVGKFDGKRFINDNPDAQTMWTDYGKDCYCALTFNNLLPGQRPVMLGWMSNWQYAKQLPTPPWRGQMTFPRSLQLKKTSEGIRLIQAPVDQLEKLESADKASVSASGDLNMVNSKLKAAAMPKDRTYQLNIEVALGNAKEVGWRLLDGNGSYALIGYDSATKRMFVDRSRSGPKVLGSDFLSRVYAPLSLRNGVWRIKILVDRNSIEVFADEGRVAMTNLVFPPEGATGIQAYAKDGTPGRFYLYLKPIGSSWAKAN